jgi:putative membrane protein
LKGINLIFKDLRLMWQHKHGRVALVFLLIVPLIYAGFFIAGYWNPYGRLDKLPVAVVNTDQGSIMDNKPIDAGKDFVKSLKKNKDLNFQFVSEKEADTGLKEGNYYMVITIPKDFSKKVSSLMDDHPQPAKLLYKINPGKNFVASQISTTATEEMKTKISNSITKSYADGVFSKFQDIARGFKDAGDGAAKINQGTSDAQNGMVQLSDGVHRLNDGSQKLFNGSSQLVSSEQSLNQGMDSLKSGSLSLSNGLSQLANGQVALQSGADQLSAGTQSLTAGIEKLTQGQTAADQTANALKATVEEYIQSHPDAKNDPSFQQIAAMAEGLAAAADSLNSGGQQLAKNADQLAQGQTNLQAGLKQFGAKLNAASSGANQLSNGSVQFAEGLNKWEQGFSSLHSGIYNLANGGKQLDTGANKLVDGLEGLTVGSKELSTKLDDAAKQTSSIHNNNALTTMFSEPVQLEESKISTVPNYGIGITPYFLSLAFYVGGIMAANILPLGRRQDQKVTGTVHFINKLGLKYSIGFIQALIVDLVVLFVFKVHVASVPLFILSSLIISFTFMTFILMLVTVFGVTGKFIAVTLLVLQLATCGGTFPGELGNPVLSEIGKILPMSHSLRSFQDVITLGDWNQLGQQIMILIYYLVFAGGITWITSHIQHSKTEVNA